jgi:hypothetical protein
MDELLAEKRAKFGIDDILNRIDTVGQSLTIS